VFLTSRHSSGTSIHTAHFMNVHPTFPPKELAGRAKVRVQKPWRRGHARAFQFRKPTKMSDAGFHVHLDGGEVIGCGGPAASLNSSMKYASWSASITDRLARSIRLSISSTSSSEAPFARCCATSLLNSVTMGASILRAKRRASSSIVCPSIGAEFSTAKEDASASASVLFAVSWAMELQVELDGEEIVVTKSGTDFMAAYRKMLGRPNLTLTRSWVDPTSPAVSEFCAHAFQAAVSKARELGWIV
jgi:hypothetical protein